MKKKKKKRKKFCCRKMQIKVLKKELIRKLFFCYLGRFQISIFQVHCIFKNEKHVYKSLF